MQTALSSVYNMHLLVRLSLNSLSLFLYLRFSAQLVMTKFVADSQFINNSTVSATAQLATAQISNLHFMNMQIEDHATDATNYFP